MALKPAAICVRDDKLDVDMLGDEVVVFVGTDSKILVCCRARASKGDT